MPVDLPEQALLIHLMDSMLNEVAVGKRYIVEMGDFLLFEHRWGHVAVWG